MTLAQPSSRNNRVLIDGVLRPAGDGLPLDDRSALLGEGLFETIACPAGRPRRLNRHLSRLRRGLALLGWEGLRFTGLEALCRHNLAGRDGILRLTVSGGSGRGMVSRSPARWWATARTAPLGPRPPLSLVTLPDHRVDSRSPLTRLKTTSRLPWLLARRAALARGADEGLMANERGELAEGSASNVFVELDGALWTPPLEAGCLPGTARAALLAVSERLPLPLCVAPLPLAALVRADALFLTNAISLVQPVARLDGRALGPATCAESAASLLAAETGNPPPPGGVLQGERPVQKAGG